MYELDTFRLLQVRRLVSQLIYCFAAFPKQARTLRDPQKSRPIRVPIPDVRQGFGSYGGSTLATLLQGKAKFRQKPAQGFHAAVDVREVRFLLPYFAINQGFRENPNQFATCKRNSLYGSLLIV